MLIRAKAGLCCLVVTALPGAALSQASEHASTVEVIGARAMLARAGIPNKRVVVDQAFAKPDQAPGSPSAYVGLRASERNQAFVRDLKAAVGGVELRDCSKCRVKDADVVLALSDPVILGDSASLTVTAYWNRAGDALDYETVRFDLRFSHGRWEIVKATQLGVS